MAIRSSWMLGVVGLVGVLVLGCGPQTPSPQPVLRFVVSGESVTAGTYDFGAVDRGGTATLPIVVTNAGTGDLTLSGFELVGGDSVTATPGVTADAPVFRLTLEGDLSLAPGETKTLSATYLPPHDAADDRTYDTRLRLTYAGGPDDSGVFTLHGALSPLDCSAPARLDFGGVARGTSSDLSFSMSNPSTSAPRTVHVGAPESPQGPGVFTLLADSPSGDVTLMPGETRAVTVTFSPPLVGDYTGELPVQLHEACAEQRVALVGSGVEQSPWWTPATVDFGYVPPGSSVEREVTFFNPSLRALTVTDLACFEGSVPSTRYSVPDGTTLTIPAATRDASDALVPGTATLRLRFTSDVLGVKAGVLRGTVDGQAVALALRGIGGGPNLVASPLRIEVGRVAYFAAANPPAYAERRVVVQNDGPPLAFPDAKWNLKLGTPDATGVPQKPYWQVTAMNANTTVDELCVGAFDAATQTCLDDLDPADYPAAVGVLAGSSLSLPLRVTPQSLGVKSWQVTLFSNDLDQPATTLTVTAEAVVLPPCNASVSPVSLPFGVVTPGRPSTRSFRVTNHGTQASEVCLVDNVTLVPETGRPTGTPPVFSTPDLTPGVHELGPGESLDVNVLAAPEGPWPTAAPTSVTGRLSLTLSNPVSPAVDVTLSADIGRGCLVVMPEAWDFASAQQQCGTPARTVTLYNDCVSTVTLLSMSLDQSTTEFSMTGAPSQPVTLAPGASFTDVQVSYRPVDVGDDAAKVQVVSLENGQRREVFLPLTGRGETTGANVERFTLPQKADVLMVLDDSGSGVPDFLMELSGHYTEFFQYAAQHQVDYQLGVTTTTLDFVTGDVGGQLHPANGVRLLTPATPNPQQTFTDLLDVGSNGSATEMCLEPAVRAVSWPLVTDARNRGLVRADATLNFVVITNSQDQSTRPKWLLQELLRQVKGTQRPGLISYSVFGPFLPSQPPGCYYDSSGDNGDHANAAAALHGITEEICSPRSSYGGIAQRLGEVAMGRRDHFFLKVWPDPMSPLEVTIDGTALPANAWSYDPLTNAVVVALNYLPTPGQTVEVQYTAPCVP